MKTINTYLNLFRVDNYAKNLFLFAPMFFSFQFNNLVVLCITFVLFSCLASGVYILNDIYDVNSDKNHPTKKNRPIAAGKISIKKASLFSVLLICLSLISISFINLKTFSFFLIYLIINISYTLFLKKIPVIDVLIISSGFLIRILIGSSTTNIPLSNWILVLTFLLSMFLGFSKRYADVKLSLNKNYSSKNIKIYTLPLINKIVIFFGILIDLAYIVYTQSDDVIVRIGNPYVFITSIWVFIGVWRYLILLKASDKYKDPTAIIINDWKLQACIICWILTFIALKYI